MVEILTAEVILIDSSGKKVIIYWFPIIFVMEVKKGYN